MTILEVTRMWSRDGSTLSSIGSGRYKMTVQEGYQVVHSVDATQLEIQAAAGLPGIDFAYNGTDYVYVNSLAPQRVSPIMSVVVCNYEGETSDGGIDYPEISYTDAATTAAVDEDYDGNPIVTAVSECIEGVTKEIADPVMRIRRKYRSFSQYATAAYRDATNSDTFNGWPPGTARLTQFDAKFVGSPVNGIWDVSATITFRWPYRTTAAKAWYARVLHQGYYEIDLTLPSGRKRCVVNGEPSVRPVMLDVDGHAIDDPADAVWREYKLYGSLPYNALGLI